MRREDVTVASRTRGRRGRSPRRDGGSTAVGHAPGDEDADLLRHIVRRRRVRGASPHEGEHPRRGRECAPAQVPLYQAQAEFSRVLGHPVRIGVLELLRHGPVPVRDLLADIGIEPSSLSQQPAVLRRSDIVVSVREGSTVRYALAGGDVAELLRAARRMLTGPLAGQSELLAELRQTDTPLSSAPGSGRG